MASRDPSVVEIDSLEHAKSVLRSLRSTSSSQRQYQQIGPAGSDEHVFGGVQDFNRVVKKSKDEMVMTKLAVNKRFGSDLDGYSESEIIRTTFDNGGDTSGFEYDSFGDKSPQKVKSNNVSVDDLRVSAEFKRLLTSSVYGDESAGNEAPRDKTSLSRKDEFGIDEDDNDEDDPYVSGRVSDLKPPIVPSGPGSEQDNSPSRTNYEKEKVSPVRMRKPISKPALAIAAASKTSSSIIVNTGGTSAVLKKGGVFVRAPPRNRKDTKGKSTVSSAMSSTS